RNIMITSAIDRYATAPQIMGAVYVNLAMKYVCTGPNGTAARDRLPADKWSKVCTTAAKKASLVIGGKSRDLVLCDTTEKHWVSMHTMPQECIVVVFWSPHCPHCQQAIPLLYEKYEKELKALGVGVYAVADARDSSLFYAW